MSKWAIEESWTGDPQMPEVHLEIHRKAKPPQDWIPVVEWGATEDAKESGLRVVLLKSQDPENDSDFDVEVAYWDLERWGHHREQCDVVAVWVVAPVTFPTNAHRLARDNSETIERVLNVIGYRRSGYVIPPDPEDDEPTKH